MSRFDEQISRLTSSRDKTLTSLNNRSTNTIDSLKVSEIPSKIRETSTFASIRVEFINRPASNVSYGILSSKPIYASDLDAHDYNRGYGGTKELSEIPGVIAYKNLERSWSSSWSQWCYSCTFSPLKLGVYYISAYYIGQDTYGHFRQASTGINLISTKSYENAIFPSEF